jgi:uncharacterized protein (DUF2141 family)
MKTIMISLLLAAAAEPAPSVTITVRVNHVESTTGHLRIALVSSKDDFPEAANPTYRGEIAATPGTSVFVFTGVKPGSYALSLYQDLNNNKKLDKNFLGIPSEPFGFSRNPKPLVGAPDFKDAVLRLDSDQTLEITLRK